MSLVFLEMCKYKYKGYNKKSGQDDDPTSMQKKFKTEYNLQEAISKLFSIFRFS